MCNVYIVYNFISAVTTWTLWTFLIDIAIKIKTSIS